MRPSDGFARAARRAVRVLLAGWLGLHPLLAASQVRTRRRSEDPGRPDPTTVVQQQIKLREEIEAKVQGGILDPMFGPGKSKAVIDLALRLEASSRSTETIGTGEKEQNRSSVNTSKIRTKYLVPGVPLRESMIGASDRPEQAQSQTAAQERAIDRKEFDVKWIIDRLRVTVLHDKMIEPVKIDEARIQILDLLKQYRGLGEEEGSEDEPIVQESDVIFRPIDFKQFTWIDEIQRPETFIPLLFATLLFLLLLYLFGPLNRRMADLVRSLNSKKEAALELQTKSENINEEKLESEGEDDGSGGGIPGLDDLPEEEQESEEGEGEDEMKKVEYFTFVTADNVNRLVYLFLIRREEPWVIATVLSYLAPEMARAVLSAMPVELQAKVAMEALTVRQVTEEQVQAIETDIKENIDYVVGGLSRLLNVLEEADSQTRQNILEHLKNQKPLIYEMVRKSVLTFDEIVNFPDREMQSLVREIKVEDLAKALYNAPPEIIDKFTSNMSRGAAALLKESMDYIHDLPADMVEEERFKIIQQIKRLEKEGKVQVREQINDEVVVEGLIEDLEEAKIRNERAQEMLGSRVEAFGGETPAASPAGSPAASASAPPAGNPQVQAYLDAGVQMYERGQYQDCASYLQYVLGQDPSNWKAHQYLGAALQALGRGPEAGPHFDQAMQINPDPGVRQWIDTVRAGARA